MLKIVFTLLVIGYSPLASAENTAITPFSKGTLHGWESKSFQGETIYTLVFDQASNTRVLKASSDGTASGLFFEQRIDLHQTPWLNWSWKTDALYQNTNENEKSGDDFVARVYVVIDGGFFFWKTLALNYVWSSSHQTGEKWDNPFTSNATMYAVESGEAKLGTWQHYKRDVALDLRNLIGKDIQYIDAIAIMTDSDNAQQQATTYFGDIFFTAQ